MLPSRRNIGLLAIVAALAIVGWWMSGGERPVEPAPAASPEVARNRPASATDGFDRGPRLREGGNKPLRPTRRTMGRSDRMTTATASETPGPRIPRPAYITGSRVKAAGAIRRAPRDLDTTDLARPFGERLKNQAIDSKYAPYADRAYALYESRKYAEARRLAIKLLEPMDKNVSMRRLVVASSCYLRDANQAREHVSALPDYDAKAMRELCAKAGVPLP